jgi:hypothetical protein
MSAADTHATQPKAKIPRARHTFMLHDPSDYSPLGKYVSTDYRYAALKVASRGHERILLRRTNTREIREYVGKITPLDTPKQITRGDPPRTISYSKKPSVTFVKKYVYGQALPADEFEPASSGPDVAA